MTKDKKITLNSDISELQGIGAAIKEKLNKAKIFKVEDFLFLLPNRYQDKTKITQICDLVFSEYAQILITVMSCRINYGRQRTLLISGYDETGAIDIRLFNFSAAQAKQFAPGTQILVYGQANVFKDKWNMLHPEYKIISNENNIRLEKNLTPVYPTIKGAGINKIRKWVAVAISCLETDDLLDFSEEFLMKNKLSPLKLALKNIHNPKTTQKISDILSPFNPDLARIVLDELLSKQIGMLQKKSQIKTEDSFPVKIFDSLQAKFLAQLDFNLTKAQLRVIGDIFADISKNTPMNRLIQGDVGSGKTLVAFCACLQAINSNLQAVIMAPTEILAEQHYHQAKKLFKNLNIEVVWLSGKTKVVARREALQKISTGEAQLIIGTHALFQKDVIYKNLGIAIIDEQHRFGVEQRFLLREKSKYLNKMPHLLLMTATPIPRTLTMSFYADLDTSIIDELPPGRQTIETILLSEKKRDELINRVNTICKKGQQVYWVCALIEESEVLEAKAAEDLFASLTEKLPNLKIALLHGKQKSEEKEKIISEFQQNNIQLLVSTTVIEVGVDVPNASLMVIENAERFGLAQLHQLRGRVGRGVNQSYCVLIYKSPLSQTGRKRLQVIRTTTDGFEIAKKDLEIRGAGEVLGTKQSGEMLFRIADIERDKELLEKAYNLAGELIINNSKMANEIVKRWIGNDEEFFSV